MIGEGLSVTEVPDLMEPIVGVRSWDLSEPYALLRSKSVARVWMPGEPQRAACNNDMAHVRRVSGSFEFLPAPMFDCSCGIYARKIGDYSDYPDGNHHVWGSVKMWGRIIEHADGYRAQFAYPDIIHVRGEINAQMVRELYGCEVVAEPLLPARTWGDIEGNGWFGFAPQVAFVPYMAQPRYGVLGRQPAPEPELSLVWQPPSMQDQLSELIVKYRGRLSQEESIRVFNDIIKTKGLAQ